MSYIPNILRAVDYMERNLTSPVSVFDVASEAAYSTFHFVRLFKALTGDTPGSYQAVCYYKSGRILISPTHTASLDKIIRHEAWHIIDWRDNGVIDWGESVPR